MSGVPASTVPLLPETSAPVGLLTARDNACRVFTVSVDRHVRELAAPV